MTKKAKGIAYGAIGIALLSAVFSSDKKVESIELSVPDYQVEYDINTKIPVDIALSPTDADAKSIEYFTSDDSITFSDDGILTGEVEGVFDVYVVADDVTSNIISISVVDIAAREYTMAAAEAQTDDAEQTTSQEDDEKQQSDDALNSQELSAPQDADTPAENDSADQPTPNVQSDRENESNSSESTVPSNIEERSSENNTEQQSSDVPPVQETEPQNSVEVSAPEAPVVQQNPETNPLTEEPSNASAPAASGNNNFDTYDNASQQQTDSTYVLNTNTMKIHHPTCSSVPKIAPHNYATSNATLNELLAQGYSTCGICFK